MFSKRVRIFAGASIVALALFAAPLASAQVVLSTYGIDMFPSHGGYTQGQCWSESGSRAISTSAASIVMNPTGGPSSSNVNAVISNQGGSLSYARFQIKNASGVTIYQSPSDPDIGVFVGTIGGGYTSNTYRWSDAPRTVNLPSSGAPYTIYWQGYGCNGWSSDSLVTWAGFQVAEYSPPAATCSISVSPSNINSGGSATLTWSSTNGTSMYISNVGYVSSSGSVSVGPSQLTTYSGTATGSGGSGNCQTTLVVNTVPLTCSISFNPAIITTGQSSTLTWSTTGATGGSISPTIGNAGTSGTWTVSPSATTTYTGTATTTTTTTTTGTQQRIYLTSGTSWTVPANWNNSNNTIEVIGGGGGGGNTNESQLGWGGGGGGGGAYSRVTNLTLTPNSSVSYVVGNGGAAASTPYIWAGAGGETRFNGATCATASVCAKGGDRGNNATDASGGGGGGTGGLASAGTGSVKYNGGSGYSGTNYAAGGGGGAAGLHGAGGNGSGTSGGTGDAGYTAAGASGTQWTASYGSGGGGNANGGAGGLYGAGGAGVRLWQTAGAGRQGIIVITYTPVTTTTTTSTANCSATLGYYNTPAPTITFGANPTSILRGNSSTLTWTSTNATSCTGTNFSTGDATSGSVAVSPNSNTSYDLSCTGPGGTTNYTGTVDVTVSCAPIYSCSGQTIQYTDASCTTTNVTTCVSPTYCSAGSSSCIVPEVISSGELSNAILATPRFVRRNSSATVRWDVDNAESCVVSGSNGDSWSGSSGTQTSSPITQVTTFTLACDDHDEDTVRDDFTETATVRLVPSWLEF